MDSETFQSKIRHICTWIAVVQWGIVCGIEVVFVAVYASTEAFDAAYGSPSSARLGIITGIYPICAAIGSFLVLLLGSFLLKKTILVLSSWLWVLGYSIAVACRSQGALIAARAVKGISVGIISSTVAPYVSEVATKNSASRLMIGFQASVPIGIIITAVLSATIYRMYPKFTLYWCWLLGAIPALPVVIVSLFCVNEKVSVVHRGSLDYSEEVVGFKQLVRGAFGKRGNKEYNSGIRGRSTPVRDLCFVLRNRRTLGLLLKAAFVQVSVYLTGINIMFYYVREICRLSGFRDRAADWTAVGLYTCHLVATAAAIPFVHKLPRIQALRICSLVLSSVLGVIFIVLFFGERLSNGEMVPALGNIAVTLYFVFVDVFSFLYAGLSYVYTAEVVPYESRTACICFAVGCGWIANAAISFVAPILMGRIGTTIFYMLSVITGGLHVYFTVAN